MFGYVCREPAPNVAPSPTCGSDPSSSTIQDFLDSQTNFPVPQQSSYRIRVPVASAATYYLFLSLIGPPPPPPLGLLRVGLEIFYGDPPTLCPQNLQLDSATHTTQTHKHTNTQTHKHTNTQTHKHTNTQTKKQTHKHKHKHTQTHTHSLQVPPQLKNANARCSWFLSFPLANRIYFSATFRPNSCTAIEIVSPSSGQKVTLNGEATAWPSSPVSFANWEGSAVITAYTVYRYPTCTNTDLNNKILLSWQALFAESDPAFFRPDADKVTLVNGQFNVTSSLPNVPSPVTNASATPATQFQRRLWMKMEAGQVVTVVAKDTNTGSPLNRLSTAPVPLIMVAKDRIPTTYASCAFYNDGL